MALKFYEYYYKLPIPDRIKENVFDESSTKIPFIENLSKVNLFVGQNNSGKSLLLREILKDKGIKSYLIAEHWVSVNNIIAAHKQRLIEFLSENLMLNIIGNQNELSPKTINNMFKPFDGRNQVLEESMQEIVNNLEQRVKNGFNLFTHSQTNSRTSLNPNQQQNVLTLLNDTISSFSAELEHYKPSLQFERVYCPTVRSLRRYPNATFLKEKTEKEYSFTKAVKIENGQNLYDDILDMMTDTHEIRQKKTNFENFLSEYFFEGQAISITPNKKKNELSLKIGDETERPIYDLGDGLQMIIILTFPLFLYDAGIILIEEPEVFMHPGLQRKLMETFTSHPNSDRFQFLISTHSNHILDTANFTDDVSVYSVRKFFPQAKSDSKNANFIVNNLSHGDDSALKLLGVLNTSVYLANATIWVEGITDMLYLRKYLKAYLSNPKLKLKYKKCKIYQEGIHYAFVFSGGSNIVHYDFSDKPLIENLKSKIIVKKLCGKAFVLVDQDGVKNKRRKESFFKELGGRFKVLPVIEIENLLSNAVIQQTIKSFPTCDDIDIPKKNFLVAGEYRDIRMGTYIEKYLLKQNKDKNRKKFTSPNKPKRGQTLTVNSKLEFCNKALPHISYLGSADFLHRTSFLDPICGQSKCSMSKYNIDY